MSALAVSGSDRLAELESRIERGLSTFVEVGQALLEIRDSRLYRETHSSFDAYCRERWNFSKQRGIQLMQAAQVATTVATPPTNESQTRELSPLLDRPEELRAAWNEVVEAHPEPTAADVREVVSRRMGVHYSSSTDLWSTPQDLFDELDGEFGFTLDVCATPENAKCDAFFTEGQDGLAQDWSGVCWMNPPYGDAIARWVEKAYESAKLGATVVCLVPARVDTGWWWRWCRHGEIRFLRGRLKFGGSETGAPFPSAVVVFGRPANILDAHWERAA